MRANVVLPPLFGPADDEYPFGAFEVEVVADNLAALGHQLVRQRDVERSHRHHALGLRRDGRVAEREVRAAHASDQLEIGHVELHLAVEPRDRRVEVVAVALAVLGALRELVGVKPGDAVEDSLLDLVHLDEIGQSRQVAPDRPLPEPGERLQHPLAVIRVARVPAHGDPQPLDLHAVADPRDRSFHRFCLHRERCEEAGGDVLGQVVAQAL